MNVDGGGGIARLIEIARSRGRELDAARAEQILPSAESLGTRLRALAEELPREAEPPPTPAPTGFNT